MFRVAGPLAGLADFGSKMAITAASPRSAGLAYVARDASGSERRRGRAEPGSPWKCRADHQQVSATRCGLRVWWLRTAKGTKKNCRKTMRDFQDHFTARADLTARLRVRLRDGDRDDPFRAAPPLEKFGPIQPGLSSVGGLPSFLVPTTSSAVTHNLSGLAPVSHRK